MLYYVFKAPTGMGMAITDDKSGAKLPPHRSGEWKFQQSRSLEKDDEPRLGFSSKEIAAAVEKNGYLVWPAKAEDKAK
jgi:hypothetical protein